MPGLFRSRKRDACTLLAGADPALAKRHGAYRDFNRHNRDALNRIAELEELYYSGEPFGMGQVRLKADSLLASVNGAVRALGVIEGKPRESLVKASSGIGDALFACIEERVRPEDIPLVLPFARLGQGAAGLVGAKAANLAEVGNALGLPVPPGFAVTTRGFWRFIDENGLEEPIARALDRVAPGDPATAERVSGVIRDMILSAHVRPRLREAIENAAREAAAAAGRPLRWAVRSSAVGEDTSASFAGQYASVLNVTEERLAEAYKEVLASKYGARAVLYRLRHGFDDADTPMCVAFVAMQDAAAAGVMYTGERPGLVRITAVPGLGETLVGGEASPETAWVDAASGRVVEREEGAARERLVTLTDGGTRLEALPEEERGLTLLDDSLAARLAAWGALLQEHFGAPQDVEWVVDASGAACVLQSRPLDTLEGKRREAAQEVPLVLPPGAAPLLAGGKTASRGCACGVVVMAGARLDVLPENAILVARSASPSLAAYVGSVRGIIADVGGVASHLASVAREFGVPAIFDVGRASDVLREGQEICMVADDALVFDGILPEIAARARAGRRSILESPMSRRLRALLDLAAPLNLTDPASLDFTPEACRTLHDVVRFAHENVIRGMFGAAGEGDGAPAARLSFNIPLEFYFVDLGGGLRPGLTTCDTLTPDGIVSAPMRAFWRGLAHPGISWSGGVGLSLRNLAHMMAGGMMQGGETPGGESYALVAADYMNLSIRFGYHFANLDAFCGPNPDENHVALQFSGGLGSFYGKSLRLQFLADVLARLGYGVTVTGDVLQATLTGHGPAPLAEILDQTGRLMAASRLLDVAIANPGMAGEMTAAFFNGDYDFLNISEQRALPGFHVPVGDWRMAEEDGAPVVLQDGSTWSAPVATGVSRLMGRFMGPRYQAFLDSIEAYFHFPLAVAKESFARDRSLRLKVKPVSGVIDQAAGVAFGVQNAGNYYVLRINALEDNVILFRFVNNRRLQLAEAITPVRSGEWRELGVGVRGREIVCLLDGIEVFRHEAGTPVEGYAGLWTKADSVAMFGELRGAA